MKNIGSKLAYVIFLGISVASAAAVGAQVDGSRANSPSKHLTHAGNGGG